MIAYIIASSKYALHLLHAMQQLQHTDSRAAVLRIIIVLVIYIDTCTGSAGSGCPI